MYHKGTWMLTISLTAKTNWAKQKFPVLFCRVHALTSVPSPSPPPLPLPPLVLCSHQSRLQKSAVCVCELQCTSVYLPLQDLYAAGEGKVGTDEEKIIKILGNRSVEHLREGESVSLTGQNSLTVWKQHTFTIYSSCSLLFHLNSPDSICKGPSLFR